MQKHTPLSNHSHSDRRNHHADFAREATADAFGRRAAEVLDSGDFIDRMPGRLSLLSPRGRAK